MSLSSKARAVMKIAFANKAVGTEVADAIDLGGNPQAAAVAAFGATANMTVPVVAAATFTATSGTYGIPADPTGAEVDATVDAALAKVKAVVDVKADNADLDTLRSEAEARLDAIEAKVNAIIAALKASGLMHV